MRVAIDYTNRFFGDGCQIIKRDFSSKIVKWIYKCGICGEHSKINTSDLNKGETRKCKKCSLKLKKPRSFTNYIGYDFGSGKVVAYSHKYKDRHYWLCKCNCGKDFTTSSERVVVIKCCPDCSHIEQGLTSMKDLHQICFDTGTYVIEYSNYKNKEHYWKLSCGECGTEFEDCARRIKHPDFPEVCEECSNYTGTILTEEQRFERRVGMQNWSRKVKQKFNYTCVITGETENLHSHHLYNYSTYPKLRYDVDNGVCITKNIHILFHRKYGTKNNTKEQFIEFCSNFNKG